MQSLRDVRVGEEAVFTKVVTTQDVVALANATGDNNPLHLDAAFAARTRFGRPVAHGVLATGFISAAIAGHFVKPRLSAILVSASHKFRQPVYVGDTISACARVRRVEARRGLVFLDTMCSNQRNETVLSGEVVIALEPLREE